MGHQGQSDDAARAADHGLPELLMASLSTSRLDGEQGAIVVLFGLLLPFFLLLGSLALDIGQWYVHKRHLQTQVDAAALAGGGLFAKCFSEPTGGNAAMRDEATKYAGGPGALYNEQYGPSPSADRITIRYNSPTFAVGGPGPDDTPEQGPCESFIFDVKGTEARLPLIFNIPGLPWVEAINARARVSLRTVEVQKGLLPFAVPDLRFNYVFATFVDEASGATLATTQLFKSGTSGDQQLWSSTSAVSVPISAASIGVRLRLVGSSDPTTPCGRLFTECYDMVQPTKGVVHIRGWTSGAATPAVRNAWLLSGTCAPDAYFAIAPCSAGLNAQIDFGSRPITGPGITTEVWASVGGSGKYPLTPGGSSGLVTWSIGAGLPIAAEGPNVVSLHWTWEQTSGSWQNKTCTKKNNNPCAGSGSFGDIQRAFVATDERSGPVQRVQVFEPGVSSMGANSFQRGSSPSLGVSIAVTGSLKLQSQATDPVIKLRVTGSQNQSIDCDPALPNLRSEIENGCGPAYTINTTLNCPAYNAVWSLPEPWACVKTQTGGAVGQVEQGMTTRVLGGANTCTAPINWPDWELDDPRVVQLIITPFGTFGGSGNDVVPVIDFGTFYVVGWNGDPCPGAYPVPKGYIVGHFIKYAGPNPHGAGSQVCSRDALTPCVAVMTK
jgi:hypothetical protein